MDVHRWGYVLIPVCTDLLDVYCTSIDDIHRICTIPKCIVVYL